MSEEAKVELQDNAPAQAEESAVAKTGGSTLRLKILVGLLILCVADVAWEKMRGNALAASLQPFADKQLAEYNKTSEYNGVKEEYASAVYAGREYVMYGEMLGTVAIYIKKTDPSGEHFTEVDFVYTRDGNDWKFRDSGGCDEQNCRAVAMKAFGLKPTPPPPMPERKVKDKDKK